jgi:hypothetical protein
MIIKSIFIAVFVLIIISLGSALYHLAKGGGQEQSEKIVKALTFRITLSIVLFILVFIALSTGLFQPSGIGMQMHRPVPQQPKPDRF